jgi:hypothetical protein
MIAGGVILVKWLYAVFVENWMRRKIRGVEGIGRSDL